MDGILIFKLLEFGKLSEGKKEKGNRKDSCEEGGKAKRRRWFRLWEPQQSFREGGGSGFCFTP